MAKLNCSLYFCCRQKRQVVVCTITWSSIIAKLLFVQKFRRIFRWWRIQTSSDVRRFFAGSGSERQHFAAYSRQKRFQRNKQIKVSFTVSKRLDTVNILFSSCELWFCSIFIQSCLGFSIPFLHVRSNVKLTSPFSYEELFPRVPRWWWLCILAPAKNYVMQLTTHSSLNLNFAFRFDGDSGSDIEMTTQLRGNVSPLTPPLRMAPTTPVDNTAEIELPPLPPPPGDQVVISTIIYDTFTLKKLIHLQNDKYYL